MKINDKRKLLRNLWFYKRLFFVSFETDNPELMPYISLLNIKSRYKRIAAVYDKICDEVDFYYEKCQLCDFKNGQCILHRIKKLKYHNGCCRFCLHQTDKGCSTRNIACKLFVCSKAKVNNLKILDEKDIDYFKFYNLYQRSIAKSDYFASREQAIMDLYVGPICLTLRFLYRGIIYF